MALSQNPESSSTCESSTTVVILESESGPWRVSRSSLQTDLPVGSSGVRVTTGNDIIDLGDPDAQLSTFHRSYVSRVCDASEVAYLGRSERPDQQFWHLWCAKEAAFKALGTGLGEGMRWYDVEVVRAPSGKPELQFHGVAQERVNELGATRHHLTITHGNNLAVAQVILEKL